MSFPFPTAAFNKVSRLQRQESLPDPGWAGFHSSNSFGRNLYFQRWDLPCSRWILQKTLQLCRSDQCPEQPSPVILVSVWRVLTRTTVTDFISTLLPPTQNLIAHWKIFLPQASSSLKTSICPTLPQRDRQGTHPRTTTLPTPSPASSSQTSIHLKR